MAQRKVASKKSSVKSQERQLIAARKEIMQTLVAAITSRRQFAQTLGMQFNGQRSLYDVLGYKQQLIFDDYYSAYDRGDIAQRIIDAPPISTWRRPPVISNDGNANNFTEFETQWAALVKRRRIFHYLERADRMAGIGEYGALFIGTDDARSSKDFARPMGKLRKGIDSVLYLAPLTQQFAEIASVDSNPTSPRFGLPETYSVLVAETVTNSPQTSASISANNMRILVHWTRIIHIAENPRENDVFGTPRLKHVMNRLFDVDKIAGGSAEIFWQAAKRLLILQAKDGFSAVDSDDALTEMMDEVVHGLRRVIDLQGYEAKTLEQSDVKPDEAFRVCLALISSATGIPQRILLGSEQGKMASTQDEVNWNGRIADRQLNFAEPVILRPFIDRLIQFGALPNPGNEYTVTWPTLFELSDKEKAQIGLLKARAIAQYIGTGKVPILDLSQQIVPLQEFREQLLNLRSTKIENTASAGGQADIAATPASAADTSGGSD